MTNVNTNNTNNTSTTTNTSAASLSANFETFMTLLTAQLKNQDPLSPMDTSEFTNQLVQYSEVEQSMKTNKLLENLNTLMTSNSGSYAVSYLGKSAVTTNTTATLTDNKAKWDYSLNTAAANVTLYVYDSKGILVKSVEGDKTKGAHSFEWNGKNSNGTQLTSGDYTFKVVAKDAAGKAVTTNITRTGTITAVDLSGDEPKVQLGGTYVPMSDITSIKQIS